ncbi:hypothetical protein RhiirA4_484002 [Rhizophagus irregularis]|uniref:RNase H type-1 domain-containing protein n=1 Tax=Rhizophagus irregularis TaxID=588596 RepID=A0A2I1HNI3_9GLOM|nr:hypothetical protein RhiirA4_484002 [Rhizophagus irregularis]
MGEEDVEVVFMSEVMVQLKKQTTTREKTSGSVPTILSKWTQKLLKFNVFKKSSTEHKSLLPFYNNQIFFVATKPFHTLRHLAFEHFIKLDKSPLKIITPTTVDVSFTSTEIKNVFDHIDNALLCHPIIKTELKSCAKILENERLLTFYTDGSVQNIGSTHSLSGYGWTQVQPFTPKVTFKGSTVFFPSSTKSETMGILTAIIVSPYYCNLNIYTDSASCIQLFNTRLHSPVISPRQKLKQTNFLLWDLIFFLINEKHLLITLHKVTGHSSNAHNDEADHRNVRKWSDNVIQPLIFNSMINNKALLPIKQQILNGDIDWSFTKEWLQHNPTDAPCGAKLSKIQGNKIKKCNFIYPTIDIQQRNYTRLYPIGNIPCKDCNDIQDSNAHIGICHNHSNNIITLLLDEGYNLLQLIRDNTKETPYALEATISSSRFFDTNFNGPLLTSHPCYLLIHNLVPNDLTRIFYIYIKDKKLRFSLFIQFITQFMEKIDVIIWKRRNTLVKAWERSLYITKNKKRFYRPRVSVHIQTTPIEDNGTNQSPRRVYTHRRATSSPYSREGGFYNDRAHIRWTSSNFLHSGKWTKHRDNFWFDNRFIFFFKS